MTHEEAQVSTGGVVQVISQTKPVAVGYSFRPGL